jgi:biotin carboxylase
MQELLIFIVNINSIKVPLKAIIGQRKAYLVCSSRCYGDLSKDNHDAFEAVYCLEDFNDSTTSNQVQMIIDENASASSVKFVTNDECSNDICLKLHQQHIDSAYQDTSTFFQFKDVMKEQFTKAGLPTYLYQIHKPEVFASDAQAYVTDVIARLSLPMVAKPIDSTGSQGVNIIHTDIEFKQWCEQHASASNFELCEYVNGNLYHCDAVVIDGRIEYTRMGKNSFPCHQIAEGKNIGTIMVPTESEIFARIKDLNDQLVKAFKPRNGVTHMEVFERPNGELVLLEVCDRPPGGEMRWMYMTADGMDIEEAHFNLRIGNDVSSIIGTTYGKNNAAWTGFPCPQGTILKLNNPDIHSEFDINWKVDVGDETLASRNLDTPKAGILKMTNHDNSLLVSDYEVVKNFAFVEVA